MTISIGASIALFRDDEVLLIKRGKPPFFDHWSFPGGGLNFGEEPAQAATRELFEETGLQASGLLIVDVISTMSDKQHAPASQVIIVFYTAFRFCGGLKAGSDALDAVWFSRLQRDRLLTTPGLEVQIEQAAQTRDRWDLKHD